MKKLLTMLSLLLFCVVGASAQGTWKANAETSVAAGTKYVEDDFLKVETVFEGTLKASEINIGGKSFSHYVQVRVDADPSAETVTGTETSGNTPLVFTVKKDTKVTFYYRRQPASSAYTSNDGKDMKVANQADPTTPLDGILTKEEETADGKYAFVNKVYTLAAGTYTVWGRGTTIQFFGFKWADPTLNTYWMGFTNADNWANVYAYTWSGDGGSKVEELGKWPGTKLNKDGRVKVSNVSYDYYLVELEAASAPANIIFHNGEGTQTSDLTFETGTRYDGYVPAATISKVQLLGDWNWNTATDNITLEKQGDTFVYTGTLDLTSAPTDQKFKLVVNGSDWIGYDGLTINAPDGWVDHETSGDYNYILKNGNSGYKTYTITATWLENPVATNLWTVKIEGKDERPTTYGIVGDFFYVDAENDGWANDQVMTKAGENVYTLTVENFAATAKKYDYKLRKNGAWGIYDLPASGNNEYTFNEAGTYDLTFTANVAAHTLDLSVKKHIALDKEFVTFSSKHGLDFTGLDVKAYRAETADGKVVLKQVNGVVPNNVGIVLRGTAGETYKVPIAAGDDIDGATNLLVAANNGYEIATSSEGSYNYVLATQNKVQGFYQVTSAYTMTQDGKAYLHTTTALAAEAAAAPAWIIEGDVTGIESVTRETITDNAYYNLAGQRVAQPTKGLYIVNGKKVIVK